MRLSGGSNHTWWVDDSLDRHWQVPRGALPFTRPELVDGLVDRTSTTTRVNLVPNPSFGVDLTGWSSANSVERITSEPYHLYGSAALVAYTGPAVSDTNMAYTTTVTTTTTGNHVISAWLFTGAGNDLNGKTVGITVEGGTATVTPGASTAATLTADTWVRVSLVVNVTGNGTVLFVLRISVAPSTVVAYTPLVIDGVMMESGSALLPFFDGHVAVGITPTAQSWSGTPENSSSSITYRSAGYVQLSTSAMPAGISRSQASTGVTVSPTAAAIPTGIPRSSDATGVTVAPTTAAAGARVRTSDALAVTISPTPAAAPTAMTKTQTATGITVSPTTAADLGAVTKTQTATGVTVSPTALADGFVTSSRAATGVTVSPAAVAAPGPIDKSMFAGLEERRNLGPNPTFEVDLKGWQTYVNASIARVTTGQRTGSGAVQVTCTADGAYGLANTGTTATRPQVVAGKTYMVSCYAKAVVGTPAIAIYLWTGADYYQPAWAYVTNSSTWARALVGFTAKTSGDLTIAIGKAAAGVLNDSILIDDVLIEEIKDGFLHPREYFDGTANEATYSLEQTHGWDGTPHESPSFISYIDTPYTLVSPITDAVGDRTAGSGVWYGDTTVTITPTSTAAGTVDKPQSATGVVVGPTTAATPTFLTKTTTASTTAVAPTTAAAGSVARVAAALDTAVAPVSAAAAGAIPRTQAATGVVISPTTAASPAVMSKAIDAPNVVVSPTSVAAPGAITKQTTASVAVSPVTAAVPLPITDQATADVTITPSTTAAPAAMTKTASAAVTITPTSSAIPLPITDTASADTTVSAQTAASGTAVKTSTASVVIAPSSNAGGGAITKSATLALAITPAVTAAGTASKSSDAVVSITPTTAAAGTALKSGATGITITPSATGNAQRVALASASVTITPTTTTAGDTGVVITLVITPTTSATAGAISKTTDASTGVSPTTTAAATVSKPQSATAVTISPTTSAALGTVIKTATAALVVSPASVATAATMGIAQSVTISPAAQASGAVTRFATADVTITPTPSTVIPLRTAMAALAFTVSLVTSAEGTRTTYATADVVIEALSDAQAIYEAMGHTTTTISPIPFAKAGQDWFADALAVMVITQTRVETRQKRAQHWGRLRI